MAGELCLVRCPSPHSDVDLFIDFFQRQSNSPAKRQFITSGDLESLDVVQRFAHALNEQTILLNFRWDKRHTSDTREPLINVQNLRNVSDYFGQESEEDFQDRIRAEVWSPREINKLVLVSQAVIDLIAEAMSVQGDLAVLEVSSDNRVKSFLTQEQFSAFQRNAKPEKALGKSSNQSAEPSKPFTRFKVGNVQLTKSAFISESRPMIESAVQNHQRSAPIVQVDLLKAQILSVIKEGLDGIASIPGQNSSVKQALASFEGQLSTEVRRFAAQTEQLLQSALQRNAKSVEKTLSEFKVEHDHFKSQVEDGIRRLRKQQDDMGTLITELSAQLKQVKANPATGSPDKLTGKIAVYEHLNEVVFEQIQQLWTLAKPDRKKEMPIVIEGFDSDGNEDDLKFLVQVLNKKPYAIESVDLILENTSKELQLKLLRNLRLVAGTSHLPVKLPPEYQGKLTVFAMQGMNTISEKAEYGMEEADQSEGIPELHNLGPGNLIEHPTPQQGPPKSGTRPAVAPSGISAPKSVASQPSQSSFPWNKPGPGSSEGAQKGGSAPSFSPNPLTGPQAKPVVPEVSIKPGTPPVSAVPVGQGIKPVSHAAEALQKGGNVQAPGSVPQAKPGTDALRNEGISPAATSSNVKANNKAFEEAKLVPPTGVQGQKQGVPGTGRPNEESKFGQSPAVSRMTASPVTSSVLSSRQTGPEPTGSKGKAQGLPPNPPSHLDKPIILTQITGAAVPRPEGLTPEEEEKIKAVSELLGDAFSEETMKSLVELLKTDKGKVMTNDELVERVFKF